MVVPSQFSVNLNKQIESYLKEKNHLNKSEIQTIQQQPPLPLILSNSNSRSSELRSPGRSNNHSPSSKPACNRSHSARVNRRKYGSNSEDGYSRVADGRGMTPGSRIAPRIGPPTIAPGRSVEATAVTTSRRPASVSISAGSTTFTSARSQ